MKQFKTILFFELNNFIKSKAFVGVTLFLVIALAVVMFIPRVFSDSDDGIDTDTNTENAPIMAIVADDKDLSEMYSLSFAQAFTDYNVKVFHESIDDIKEKIRSEKIECAFHIKSYSSYDYYVNNLSLYDENYVIANEVMQSLYRLNAMAENGISATDAAEILAVQIEGNNISLGTDQVQNFFYAYIMIFALYMVILLYGQMVTMNVATEKSSRAMELLITSAKPESMMFGKVFASCIAGFTQLVAIFGSALLFYNINREYWTGFEMADMFFDIPPILLVYMLVFFILGFLVYAFLFGVIGSTVSKLEEVNTAVTPLMMMFIFMFIVVMTSMSSGSVDSLLMKICSYIPFTSPMAMFTRIALSDVALYEIIISISILVASVFGIGLLAAKIYRVGVLLYGTPPKITTIIKNIVKS